MPGFIDVINVKDFVDLNDIETRRILADAGIKDIHDEESVAFLIGSYLFADRKKIRNIKKLNESSPEEKKKFSEKMLADFKAHPIYTDGVVSSDEIAKNMDWYGKLFHDAADNLFGNHVMPELADKRYEKEYDAEVNEVFVPIYHYAKDFNKYINDWYEPVSLKDENNIYGTDKGRLFMLGYRERDFEEHTRKFGIIKSLGAFVDEKDKNKKEILKDRFIQTVNDYGLGSKYMSTSKYDKIDLKQLVGSEAELKGSDVTELENEYFNNKHIENLGKAFSEINNTYYPILDTLPVKPGSSKFHVERLTNEQLKEMGKIFDEIFEPVYAIEKDRLDERNNRFMDNFSVGGFSLDSVINNMGSREIIGKGKDSLNINDMNKGEADLYKKALVLYSMKHEQDIRIKHHGDYVTLQVGYLPTLITADGYKQAGPKQRLNVAFESQKNKDAVKESVVGLSKKAVELRADREKAWENELAEVGKAKQLEKEKAEKERTELIDEINKGLRKEKETEENKRIEVEKEDYKKFNAANSIETGRFFTDDGISK